MNPPPLLDLYTATHAMFAAHLNSTFTLHHTEGAPPAPLQLCEVKPLGANRGPKTAVREPFSLLFRAATRQFYVPQNTYALEHPVIGRLEIFLVPIGPDATGMRFEAIFA